MNKDREQAVVMRQSGSSYSEIKQCLGVPLSTLSAWFRDQSWSNEIARMNVKKAREGAGMKLAVLNAVRGNRLAKVYEEARQDALVDFTELKYHPLFISGIMLYMCHGERVSRNKVALSSSNLHQVVIWRRFLEEVCSVKKISVQLILKPGATDGEEESKKYWMENGGLKHEFFIKTAHLREKQARKRTLAPKNHGVCNLIVNSAYLKHKILRWTELVGEEIAFAGIV